MEASARGRGQGAGRAKATLLALLLAGLAPLLLAGPAALREYDVKAAFLYNFAAFVDWPDSAFPSPESPFVIGILGEDPFGPVLEDIVSGERIKGRPIVVRRFTRLEGTPTCHIIFISDTEKWRLKDILKHSRNLPVLTVADMPGFVEAGGLIGFFTDTRVGIKINPVAVQAAKLTVSSKLLRLAQVVEAASSPP